MDKKIDGNKPVDFGPMLTSQGAGWTLGELMPALQAVGSGRDGAKEEAPAQRDQKEQSL